MDTKAAFDREAFAKEHGMTMEFVNWFFDKKAAGCGNVWYMMAAAMWEGWLASRAAIEIELPEEMLEVVGHNVIHGRVMANDMLHCCQKAITSHGLTIKK